MPETGIIFARPSRPFTSLPLSVTPSRRTTLRARSTRSCKVLPTPTCLIAADDDGRPVAYCLLALTWSNEAGGLCVWLDELMVDASQRSRGIGRQLIAAVQEKYQNAARFRLEVTEANPRAAALYRTLGFTDLPYQQMVMDSAT